MARMTFRENVQRSKGELLSYFRHGLHELGNLLYGQGTAAAQPEYGMVGTKLPSEIARDMHDDTNDQKATKQAPQQESSFHRYTSPQSTQAPEQSTQGQERAPSREQHEPMTHERD